MKKKKIIAIIGLVIFLGVSLDERARNVVSESCSFIYALVRSPKNIGAIVPSSPFLAKKIVKHIQRRGYPINILEVGAGTGVFTGKIIEKMDELDRLDVIELDADLCEILRKKCKTYKNVFIHCLSVTDFKADVSYDFIVSGLPFNAFSSGLVASIIQKYKNLIKPNGIISYFEYFWGASIRRVFSVGQNKTDFIKNMKILQDFRDDFLIERDQIFLNIPPAYAYHLQIKK